MPDNTIHSAGEHVPQKIGGFFLSNDPIYRLHVSILVRDKEGLKLFST